jgi:SAM-dependent methyltransferase
MAEEYGPATYGDRIADVYDEWYADAAFLDTEASVERLAELARDGRVLELAIGTGRLAIPLAARGTEVHGIDASEAMVAKLREKPGGEHIPVTMGDFADVGVDGSFRLIYVAFNTLFALLTQEDQLRCFANAAAHLSDDGVFLIDVFLPDLTRFDRSQRFQTNSVSPTMVNLDASRHDALAQRVESVHVVLTESGTKLYPVNLRYAFPSELDLMARLAGLELKDRWGGWRREEFTPSSQRHVSVYGR